MKTNLTINGEEKKIQVLPSTAEDWMKYWDIIQLYMDDRI